MINRFISIILLGFLAACANQQPSSVASEPATRQPTTTSTPTMSVAPTAEQTQRRVKIPPEVLQKIGFDLNQFDNEGLITTADGKRAIIYEYCIPRVRQAVSVITTIDFSAEVKADSPGKVGCSDREALVRGSSHQDGFKSIIVKIASLSFVKRIEQSALQ